MAVNPNFIEVPFLWQCRLGGTAAAPGRDNSIQQPGNIVLVTPVGVASSQGAVLEAIWAVPLATQVANTLRLWLQRAGDVQPYFFREIAIPAVTLTATDAVPIYSFPLPGIISPVGADGIRLSPGAALFASMGVPNTGLIHLQVQGGHYGLGSGGVGSGTS